MARLNETVLADGVVYPVGTERTSELGEKIPARFWDAPEAESEKPTRQRKAKSD